MFSELLPDSSADAVPSTVRPLESLADAARKWEQNMTKRLVRLARLH